MEETIKKELVPTEKKIYSLEDYKVSNVQNLKTLEDAIDYLKNNINDGVICPCCERYTKIYRRKLNSGMAYTLIKICNISKNNEYIHISHKGFPQATREHSKLRYWGLLEGKGKNVDDDNESEDIGYWRMTDKGRKFVENKIKVPERIKLYNGEFHGFDGKDINIIQALKNKFNYDELMSEN